MPPEGRLAAPVVASLPIFRDGELPTGGTKGKDLISGRRVLRRTGFAALSAAVCILVAAPAIADEPMLAFCDDLFGGDCDGENPYAERIETERHDFTQSAVTVGRGVVQIESGYTFFYHDVDGDDRNRDTALRCCFGWGSAKTSSFAFAGITYGWRSRTSRMRAARRTCTFRSSCS